MWASASLPIQDITSLLHTIYEVVDSSVNHSPTSSKTLRVKLTVAPDGSQSKKSILLHHPGEGWRAVLVQLSGGVSAPREGWTGILGAFSGSGFVDRWDWSGPLREWGLDR